MTRSAARRSQILRERAAELEQRNRNLTVLRSSVAQGFVTVDSTVRSPRQCAEAGAAPAFRLAHARQGTLAAPLPGVVTLRT